MDSVQAYIYFRNFGVLPYAGGSFEQPARLLREMSLIHAIVSEIEEARADAESPNT